MSDRRNSLTPPARTNTTELQDPGAHELADSSDSDEHFSDAQSAPAESHRNSPIPRTRVEKVSDEPSYGEVPGTEAYRLREGDAEPDEIAIIPDADKDAEKPADGSNAAAAADADADDDESREGRPTTPGGMPIPKTVVEESPDAAGSETHHHHEKKHKADPPPDLVLKAEDSGSSDTGGGGQGGDANDTPISPQAVKSPRSPRSSRKPRPGADVAMSPVAAEGGVEDGGDGEDDFGDDFDDFEEGGDAEDFGDFADDFQEPVQQPIPSQPPPAAASTPTPTTAPAAPPPPSAPAFSFPVPDFDGLDVDEILSATEPYLNALYPPGDDDDEEDEDAAARSRVPPQSAKDNPVFLTPRSASLWSQLVAPPPLQPPDWIRSRIRRLFLVSLGVPVDLDEILPASKQKKLILPSLAVPSHHQGGRGTSPRTSTDSRGGAAALSRLRQSDGNASSTSLDSQGRPKDPSSSSAAGGARGKRKGPPPAPELDLVAARQLCATTDEALDGMTDGELTAHVARLRAMEGTAREVLEYWTKRTDEKIGDREAFEGVIENLVKHARKVRK